MMAGRNAAISFRRSERAGQRPIFLPVTNRRTLPVCLVVGARPNFVKVAALLRVWPPEMPYRLVHTGQHSSPDMSGVFFEQLGLPMPDTFLGARSAKGIQRAFERELRTHPCSLVVVTGDVTSTVACARAACRLGVPLAHVEAGLRCGDLRMPEERNRICVDRLSDWLFTTLPSAGRHLMHMGKRADQIFFTGNPMIDSLLHFLPRARRPSAVALPGAYLLLTLHRPHNVDAPRRLFALLDTLARCSPVPVLFPVHPRTGAVLRELPALPERLRLLPPQPYLEFLYLLRHARGVLTDSGGVSEEATVLNVPCLSLRASTERPETVTQGTNVLLGTSPAAIPSALDRLFRDPRKAAAVPERWDGRAGARIVRVLGRIHDHIHRNK